MVYRLGVFLTFLLLTPNISKPHAVYVSVCNVYETKEGSFFSIRMFKDDIFDALGYVGSSKEIKNETRQKMQTEEIEELALRFIRSKDNFSKTIMIIGTGLLGKSLVQTSIDNFKNIIWCYHRNKPDIKKEWKQYINLISFNEIKNKLNNTNVIISAADSNGFILTAAHAPFFDLEKTTHIVDLGMPRTIDPGLQNLSADIQILDLDGIKYYDLSNMGVGTNVLGYCLSLIHI